MPYNSSHSINLQRPLVRIISPIRIKSSRITSNPPPPAGSAIESVKDKLVRGDLARAVVESGWNLNELRTVGLSLETIFLQLTASESKSATKTAAATPEPGGSN